MRKILIAISIALAGIFTSCSNTPLSINATISGLDSTNFIVYKISDKGTEAMDTLPIVAGKFTYSEKMDAADFRLFTVENRRDQGFVLFVGNEKVSIEGSVDSLENIKVTGSENNDLYKGLIAALEVPFTEKGSIGQELSIAQQQRDSLKFASLLDVMKQKDVEIDKIISDFAKTNPNSFLSPWALNNITQDFDYEKVNVIFEGLSEEAKSSRYGNELKERLANLSKLAIGVVPPDFTLTTTDNEEFTLSAQKGKVVLIDFWAQWCKPCREENINNVALMEKYGKDNFIIAGISIDREEDVEKWMKAIADDKINYTQMRDTKEVSKEYNVVSIPTTILIGEDGKIIGKNLRGGELAKKLEELYKH